MHTRKVIIVNQAGLYGKLATGFIQLANEFKSTLSIRCGEKQANAKSLLGVLSLALQKDCEITINGNGPDEREAVDKLARFIEEGGIFHKNKIYENNKDAIIGNYNPDE